MSGRSVFDALIDDEEQAVGEYQELAETLYDMGFTEEAHKVLGISRDEGKHRDILKRIRGRVSNA